MKMDDSQKPFTAAWYPMYPSDILTSEKVELLTLAEEAAYRRALDRSWMNGSIPADPVKLAKTIGKRCTPAIAKAVLTLYEPMPGHPDRMVNERQEAVREEQRQKYLRQSAKGKSGAEQRWHADSTGIAQAMPKQWQSESDSSKEENIAKEDSNLSSLPPQKTASAKRQASPKGCRIPDPFLLKKEMIAWAKERAPTIDATEETEKFVNYYRAKTGRDATKLDWPATWQNWILNARDRYGNNTTANGNAKSTNGTREHPNTKALREWAELKRQAEGG